MPQLYRLEMLLHRSLPSIDNERLRSAKRTSTDPRKHDLDSNHAAPRDYNLLVGSLRFSSRDLPPREPDVTVGGLARETKLDRLRSSYETLDIYSDGSDWRGATLDWRDSRTVLGAAHSIKVDAVQIFEAWLLLEAVGPYLKERCAAGAVSIDLMSRSKRVSGTLK